MRRLARLSLRARLLLIGVLGVATALALGSVVLYAVLTIVGYRTLDASATATATEVATLVEQGRLPDPIPVTGNQIVQVVDSRDRVVSASVNGDRLTAVLLAARGAVGAGRRAARGAGLPGGARLAAAGRRGPRRRRRAATARRAGRPAVRRPLAQPARAEGDAAGDLPAAARRPGPDRLARGRARRCGRSRRCGRRRSGSPAAAATTGCRCRRRATRSTRWRSRSNSMLDRLAAARARQRSFVADAAHELRSPLASMQTQLEVAERLGEDTAASAGPARRGAPDDGPGRGPAGARPARRRRRPGRAAASRSTSRAWVDGVVGRYDAARVPVAVVGERADGLVVRGRPGDLRRALSQPGRQRRAARPHAGRGLGVRREGGRRRRRGLPTTARASRRRSASGSSSGSPGSTTPATATPAAAGSGWPSSASWWWPSAATCS